MPALPIDHPAARPPARTPPAPPVAAADDLTASLLRNLARAIPFRPRPGAIRTTLFGLITFGVGPILAWTFRVRDAVDADGRVLAEAAEWFRFHSLHPESAALRHAADAVRPRPFLAALPLILCALVGVVIGTHLNGDFDFKDVVGATYGNGAILVLRQGGLDRIFDAPDFLPFLAWFVGLSGAYLGLWLQLRAHEGALRRFLIAFDRYAAVERLRPIGLPHVVRRSGPWLIGGIVMLHCNAPWGPAAMFAGAAGRRYSSFTGPFVRGAVADRVRERAHHLGATSFRPIVRCERERCAAPLADGALFCHRCGRRRAAGDDVATPNARLGTYRA